MMEEWSEEEIEAYTYEGESDSWVPVKTLPAKKEGREINFEEIEAVTFNCLFDNWYGKIYKPSVVRSDERLKKTAQILKDLRPQVITLNEVTGKSLRFFENQKWVQEEYFMIGRRLPGVFPGFGNLLLTSLPILQTYSIKAFKLKRPVLVANLEVRIGTEASAVSFVAAHLSALPSNANRRKKQLGDILESLQRKQTEGGLQSDAVVIQGDLNFHSEKENKNIPAGYSDVWMEAKKDLDSFPGYTFDWRRNPMLSYMWPYQPSRRSMRLDRVFLSDNDSGIYADEIALEFDRLVYTDKYVKKEPTTWDNIRESGLQLLSWGGITFERNYEEYLMCSDHFGIKYRLRRRL